MSDLPYQEKSDSWSSHTFILECLQSLPVGSRVLDVGTASGMLARRNQNTALRFFGIEANPGRASIARPFYEKLWICSFDDIPDESLRGYSAVVMGDVLEHMPQPEVSLNRLVGLQDRGCMFIISVPNVANLWIRLNLLMGHFDYSERGILDRTHLRFFTRRSLIDMVQAVGLEIISSKATPTPLELLSPFFDTSPGRQLHAALAWFTTHLPTLLGYQLILEAKKP
jgi:2-polyprenyl-3-methyl-5-hydroxy-6-metoxy-1,4-benzoquinol methylase